MGFLLINLLRLSLIALTFLVCFVNLTRGQTSVGFYTGKCGGLLTVSTIVHDTVQAHLKNDSTIAPKLLRMHFHDCFVNGCDGSILLDGSNAEKTAIPNLSLAAAFPVIDDAKKQLEAACPGVVSCADILALAARDSVLLTGGVGWLVPTGRRDSRNVTTGADTANLPAPSDSVAVQIQKFQAKGLSIQDLVTLVGAHTIGKSDCQFFSNRLYNYQNTGGPDPTIDPKFLKTLQAQCPNGGNGTVRVALDTGSEKVFDNQYFENIIANQAVLESDQRLLTTNSTNQVLQRYVGNKFFRQLVFNVEFGKSMINMGNAGVLTGTRGEIRNVCTAIN